MTAQLTDKTLAQVRHSGLALPRAPYPGQEWTPRTPAEQHLLREGRRLDRLRMLLLEEVGRLRQQQRRKPRAERVADASRTIERLKDCPLSPRELDVIAAAAAGELPEETAARLVLAYQSITSHRQRAVSRLQARNVTHAVALCAAAGWITVGQDAQGAAL